MTNFWKDKVVFLTGASSGIGEALALALAERGAILGLVARRRTNLSVLAKACEARRTQCASVRARQRWSPRRPATRLLQVRSPNNLRYYDALGRRGRDFRFGE